MPINEVRRLQGDIQIGAVEIKDGSTDQRASVQGNGGLNVNVLSTPSETVGVGTNVYDDIVGVLTSTETDLVSYTVPTGKKFILTGGKGTGSSDAHYKLKIDGNTEAFYKTSYFDRVAKFFFDNRDGVEVAAGIVIKITVEHEESASQEFYGNLFGRLITL